MKPRRHPYHVHNCIRVRRWWRRGWTCIVCNGWWTYDLTGRPSFGTAPGLGVSPTPGAPTP